MEALNQLTSPFILRRTQDVIRKFLPEKTEFVLFCRPTPTQAYVYKSVLDGIGDSYLSLDSKCILSRYEAQSGSSL